MSITKEKKTELMQEYATVKNDTGSVHVQCAVLSERIKSLTEHLNVNKQDFQARRGLIVLVSRRRKFLRYLKNEFIF
jgi:small subunit ribosomal protein S15